MAAVDGFALPQRFLMLDIKLCVLRSKMWTETSSC